MHTTNTFVGAAWPYASGPRHLGHLAGAYIPADVIARASRLRGDDVLFVSGSDEHGTPITVAAEARGVDPTAFAAEQHERIAAQLERVGISFDHYGRTTSPVHRRVVHDVFTRLHTGGFVEEGEQLAAWCAAERRALPDRYVEGRCPHCATDGARGDQCDECGTSLDPEELVDPRCVVCGATAELRPERQLFLRLDALQPAVESWFSGASTGWRRWVAEEAAGALRTGLRSRAITRALPWGVDVPLPGWGDRVLYVWFEAVIGYLSASIEARPDDWQRWWCGDGDGATQRHKYVVGKDNVWFHAVWWPAVLAGAGAGGGAGGLRLPDDVVASQFLTESGAQLSVSRGHGTTIEAALDRAGVDVLRHALVAASPETADTAFTWELADEHTRTGLVGAIANPVHRVTTLLARRFDGRVDEAIWRETPSADTSDALAAFADGSLRRGLALVHDLGRTVNRRLAEVEPWKLPDADAHRELTALVPLLDALAITAAPVVPDVAARIRTALGRPEAIAATPPTDPPRVPPSPSPPFWV